MYVSVLIFCWSVLLIGLSTERNVISESGLAASRLRHTAARTTLALQAFMWLLWPSESQTVFKGAVPLQVFNVMDYGFTAAMQAGNKSNLKRNLTGAAASGRLFTFSILFSSTGCNLSSKHFLTMWVCQFLPYFWDVKLRNMSYLAYYAASHSLISGQY